MDYKILFIPLYTFIKNIHNMKKLVLFTVLFSALFSCSGNKKQAETTFELDNLMTMVDQKVDDTITVIGHVTHVCMHSGRRCFIVGESKEISMRVEAKGVIGEFDSELVGSKLAITGIIKEGNRRSQESIEESEKDIQKRIEAGESAHACATEMKNIEDMRKWMEKHGKDYFVIYYMDGLRYKKLEK